MIRLFLALGFVLSALPALADTIGKEVKITAAGIEAGAIRLSAQGRVNKWYRAIGDGQVLGKAAQASSAGKLAINAGTKHPSTCNVRLQIAATNTASTKWATVAGEVLLANCAPLQQSNVVTVSHTCDSEIPESWIYPRNVQYCSVACPLNTLPMNASYVRDYDAGNESEERQFGQLGMFTIVSEELEQYKITYRQFIALVEEHDSSPSQRILTRVTAQCVTQ